jgi:hypothetical protein
MQVVSVETVFAALAVIFSERSASRLFEGGRKADTGAKNLAVWKQNPSFASNRYRDYRILIRI